VDFSYKSEFYLQFNPKTKINLHCWKLDFEQKVMKSCHLFQGVQVSIRMCLPYGDLEQQINVLGTSLRLSRLFFLGTSFGINGLYWLPPTKGLREGGYFVFIEDRAFFVTFA
jgi:hypothetical protein